MYERFYNLRERPFALSPDPEYLYLSRVHREALDAIRFGIESRAGFIVVTGEVGAGKTTLLQTLLQQLDERANVARIVNTTLEPRELIETILMDFGLPTTDKSKPALLRDLGQFLVQQRTQGRRPILVIDEAQNLGPAALEEVRLLSNMETEKSKLLQILIAGQPNLREAIAGPGLEQFRQRVTVSYHLTALDASDTAAYINYRLQHAAIGEPPRFPADAAELVHRRSGGVPRIINVICDAALIFGYAEERRTINRALVEEVIGELESTGVLVTPAAETQPAAAAASEPAPIFPPAAAAAVQSVQQPSAVQISPEHLLVAREALTQAREAVAAREAEVVRQRELVNRAAGELAAREEALARRERQIAEQRQIMNDEYRLLRQHQVERAAALARGDHAARFGAGRDVAAGSLSRAESGRHPRHSPFWQRIGRFLRGREAALRS